MNLSKKKCTPCRGEVSPLKGDALIELHRQLGGGWEVIDEHHLEKEYIFKNFSEALAFTNFVGAIAEAEGHHPDLLLSYGKVKIMLWTHKIDGLTESDFILAAKCDDTEMGQQIQFADFLKVDIRVGTIVKVEEYPEARKAAYKLEIDFGELGRKRSSAQITQHYSKEELVGSQIIAVVNFPPKQIGKFMSEVLTLGLPDANGHVILLKPTLKVPDGNRLF